MVDVAIVQNGLRILHEQTVIQHFALAVSEAGHNRKRQTFRQGCHGDGKEYNGTVTKHLHGRARTPIFYLLGHETSSGQEKYDRQECQHQEFPAKTHELISD